MPNIPEIPCDNPNLPVDRQDIADIEEEYPGEPKTTLEPDETKGFSDIKDYEESLCL